MKLVAIWASPPYGNDELFNADNALNRDDCLAGFRKLRSELRSKDYECATQDVCRRQGAIPDIVLFLDIPQEPIARLLGPWAGRSRCWLLLQEPATIIPRNWDLSLHRQFERIYTWSDDLVNNGKYFKINYALTIPDTVPKDVRIKEKLCTLIAGQHRSDHPDELYSERIAAIQWFERNHLEDFDLYGRGWDEFYFSRPGGMHVLNHVNLLRPLRRLLAPAYVSYRGPVAKKAEVLKRYKFCICYENVRGLNGYITEKIFDCFSAGCVPIYWGAENVIKHIPGDCFIDKRAFGTYEELYRHLVGISDASYLMCLGNAEQFLRSGQGYLFTAQHFAETIVRGITGG
jgi:alpha(1,3/1,4) fucosyltransferase